MPTRDPSRMPELMERAIEAQDRGDEKGLGLAIADMLMNTSTAQHYPLLRALDAYPNDMRKVREVMQTAVRLNAEAAPEKRITPARRLSAPDAANLTSATVAGRPFPKHRRP
ncbi:hypothetical protein [Streptomyces platensis]|uniref:hypothetical protein n=1 Tax=Streptomyces platensis TaxID=58346 RepID=UPI003318764E